MNSFNKNKEIIKVCKNYYEIVNSDTYKNDKITSNIVKLYKDYIFGMDIITQREREKMVSIDNIMYKFVTDIRFKKEMENKLSKLTISKNVIDLVSYVMNKMIEYFEDYKDTYTRNIYIPRWI
mgnify:CR=1 FL=1